MATRRKPRTLWWALRRGPNALPVVFDTKQGAVENADPGERLYRVRITNVRAVSMGKRRGAAVTPF